MNICKETRHHHVNDMTNEKYQNNAKYSSYFRLYEYQIVEMQHEYELLLEDKVNL